MSFIEKKTDYFMMMQLKDLATSFMHKDVDIQYNQVSFLDIHTPKVTISSFWENRTSKGYLGEKSDVYLRALGNYVFSDRKAIIQFLKSNVLNSHPAFSKQLLAFLEDLRLEEIVLSIRPGTKKAFDFRRSQYVDYFRDQLKVNSSRGFDGDALFCYLCLIILDSLHFNEEYTLDLSKNSLIKIRENIFSTFEKNTTGEIVELVWNITNLIKSDISRDMINVYFSLPKIEGIVKIENDEDEIFDETLPTWTRKRKKQTQETFLQFDDVDGEHQDIQFSSTPRESESTDQVMAIVQGNTKQTDINDHSETPSQHVLEDQVDQFNKGKENRHAIAIDKELLAVTDEDINVYNRFVNEISLEKKKLIKLLQDLLERKRENNIRRLHFGKLDKKLLPFFTEDQPKLFIKKEEDNTYDCAFSLLVDCSSSMMNKMEQTKKSIILFHEALKQLQIPHSITGFYEDGMESDDTYQPNYFQEVISFKSSFQQQVGPTIMQLQPEEDNRDGFAIRYIANKLKKQSAKHKFILILTDGKPAAFNYFQNGVMDTKESIQEVRKQGIEAIGIQIDNQNEQHEQVMEAIYNNNYLIIESLHEMPGQFASLLKKLLIKVYS